MVKWANKMGVLILAGFLYPLQVYDAMSATCPTTKSLKSRVKDIFRNKCSLSEFIKSIPLINGNDKLKICICDPNVKPCCPQSPPSLEQSRKSELTKKNRARKTYLARIVDRERQFRKTSRPSNAGTELLPITQPTNSCPIVLDDSSTVFTGSIECPSDKKQMDYYLWIRPNKKKRTVLCVHSERIETSKLRGTVQANKKG